MNVKRELPIREKNIVLVGFMGVGKTTIGQMVAKRLYRDFIDIDVEIESRYGMPITDIFKHYGETKFRQIERDLIVCTCAESRMKIVSLGGGAYMQEDIRNACQEHCIVFYLDLSWDSWKERLPLIIDSRPVLQSKTIDEIEQLFNERKDVYALTNSKFSTHDSDPDTVADSIVESVKLAWEMYQPQ